MMVFAGVDGFWKYEEGAPGPPGEERPNIDALGALFPEELVKLRVWVAELLLLLLRAATAAESTRAEHLVAAWRARPCRVAGTRPLCMVAMVIVTVAASAEVVVWRGAESTEQIAGKGKMSR